MNATWQIPRRLLLLAYVAGACFLVAHALNAYVAEALYLPPAVTTSANIGATATPVSFTPQQWADEVQTSGLFTLPAVQPGMAGGGTPQAPMGASLGAANKVRLIGVVFGAQRGVFAIVEELSSKKQALYRLHDQIPEIGEVSEIRRDGMVVRSGALEELLELSSVEKPLTSSTAASPPAVPQAPGAPIRKVVDRREVEQAMADLPKLLTQARAVPYVVNGAPNGYRMDYIAPASFYEKIGIQYGDVVQRVNGVDVRDPSTMLSLFQQLKNERMVKVDLVRNNQKTTVTYELR